MSWGSGGLAEGGGSLISAGKEGGPSDQQGDRKLVWDTGSQDMSMW